MGRIEHILIANRGEIAARVIRTCRSLGVRTTAVYSDADVDEPHVRMADAAVHIGPSPAAESYLVIDRLVRVAVERGCDAVHPGYGFLSENADFATAVEAAGLKFIGPSPETIRLMGDKAAAKRFLAARGVPVVPGVEDDRLDDDGLVAAAGGVGFPLLVKAVAGGGGKGMRTVRAAAELREAVAAARREAASAFGDDRLIVEQLVAAPRHIEFQVFGDRFGHAIHLLERECSIQRRHQKVVEECPSPAMTDALRARMGAVAVSVAQAVAYEGAGTVEFLVAGDTLGADEPDFFFLEMNTRLQVEHPVTEAVLGLDLVELQIRIASGEPLPITQDDVVPRGHAIEVRLYAEDPVEMLPQFGEVRHLAVPQLVGIRADMGVATGSQVGRFYDPMLGKLIAHGSDRNGACDRMESALRDFMLHGVRTNQDLLLRIVKDPVFRSGVLTTAFLDERFRRAPIAPTGTAALIAAVLSMEPQGPSLWSNAGPYRPMGIGGWPCQLADGASTWDITVSGIHDQRRVDIDGRVVDVAGIRHNGGGSLTFLLEGRRVEAHVTTESDDDRPLLWVHVDGMTRRLMLQSTARAGSGSGASDANRFNSPMPGVVTQVNVADGDRVTAGMILVVIEAMKMEHPILAPDDGVISGVRARVGQMVTAGFTLLAFDAAGVVDDDSEVADGVR